MRTYRKYNWPELIASFEQSGLSQTAFCEQHQINPQVLQSETHGPFRKVRECLCKGRSNRGKDNVTGIRYPSGTLPYPMPGRYAISGFC